MLLIALFVLGKKFVYDKIKSISYIEQRVKSQVYDKLMIGNLLLVAVPKEGKGFFNYELSSMYPKKPADIMKLGEDSKIKNIVGMFPSET